jgi:hypothetical protein
VTVLYAVVCAAPPVHSVRDLVEAAAGYDLCLIATPTAAVWLQDSLEELRALTGHPVRSTYKLPTEPDVLPPAEAMLVAPATFNTLNKWAAGISDTLALGLMNEALGLPIPIVAVPWVNEPLALHPALSSSLSTLRSAGVRLISPQPSVLSWRDALEAFE